MSEDSGIVKHSFTFHLSEEYMAAMDGFPQKGHVEKLEITEADRLAHKRARKALKELESSEWVYADELPELLPLKREKWVPDETAEEWLARYREAKASGWQPWLSRGWRSWVVGEDGYEHAE